MKNNILKIIYQILNKSDVKDRITIPRGVPYRGYYKISALLDDVHNKKNIAKFKNNREHFINEYEQKINDITRRI